MAQKFLRRCFGTCSLLSRGWTAPKYRGMPIPEFIDGVPQISGVSIKQYPVKIKWYRPQHVTRVSPVPEGSGDCESLPSPTDFENEYPVTLSKSSLLPSASPEVKKVSSLKFQRHSIFMEYLQEKVLDKIRHHSHDTNSLAVQIACLTLRIRNHQKSLEKCKNQAKKHSCKILIDVRRHYLGTLRSVDYKQFEWLLEKLNIVYKPPAAVFEEVQRRKHTERLTELWCSEFKEYKLNVYKLELEKQKPEFLERKATLLKWILKEEQELGLETSVSEKDVDECLKRAEKIKSQLVDKTLDCSSFKVFKPESIENNRLKI